MDTAREIFLINAMNAGMSRAARSFSVMINSPVKTNPTQIVAVERNDNFLPLKENAGGLYLLTTQLIGSVTGKSYLVISEKESEAILRHLRKDNPELTESLLDAFLMEIDNIVSAAVISELSDKLKIEVYGDVPQMKRMNGGELYPYLAADKDERSHSSLIINTGFTIEKCPDVRPQFIWKISPALLDHAATQLRAVQTR